MCVYACLYWLEVCDEQLQGMNGVNGVNGVNNRYVPNFPSYHTIVKYLIVKYSIVKYSIAIHYGAVYKLNFTMLVNS